MFIYSSSKKSTFHYASMNQLIFICIILSANTFICINSQSTTIPSSHSSINIIPDISTLKATVSSVQSSTSVSGKLNSTYYVKSNIKRSITNGLENSDPLLKLANNQTPITNLTEGINSIVKNPNIQFNCNASRTCTECAKLPTCNWLTEKQICVQNSIPDKIENVTVCPKLLVNFEVLNNLNIKHIPKNLNYSINVKIDNDAESFKKFLNKSNIICKADDLVAKASFINNEVISCNITPVPYESVDNIVLRMNPLHIIYFSIYANETEISFDNPKDHYASYHGLNCPESKCETSYWEDESNQFYCKWCSKSETCPVKTQQSKCDIRQLHGNHSKIINELPEIEIKGTDLQIEYFEPTYGLYMGGIPLKIFVKGNLILNENRQINITVAGRQCTNVNMTNDKIITCIVAVSSNYSDLNVGPVIITYSSTPNYVLKSKQMFTFIYPKITSVSPNLVPVMRDEPLKITGQYLNATRNVKVHINDHTECIVQTIEENFLECLISDIDYIEPFSPGKVAVMLDDITVKNKSMAQLIFVGLPYVIPGQTFGAISSGGNKIVVRGRFPAIENATFYTIDNRGRKRYADCLQEENQLTKVLTEVVCYTPNLNDTNIIPPSYLRVGFHIYYDGRPIELISPHDLTFNYLYHEDPDFIDFGTDLEDHYVSFNGDFAYTGYHVDDIYIPIGKENCTMKYIVGEELLCHTETDNAIYAAYRSKELKVYVGKNVVGTALRRPRPPYMKGFVELIFLTITQMSKTINSIIDMFSF